MWFLPNPNDENFYCRVCQSIFINISGYHDHIKRYHDLDLTWHNDMLFKDPALNDQYPEYCNSKVACKRCDGFTFETRQLYHPHLRKLHQIVIPRYKCTNYSCHNASDLNPAGIPTVCAPCKDSNTTRKRKYFTKPMVKKKREPLIVKYMPSTEINLLEDTVMEEPPAFLVKAPTINVG